MKTVITYTLFFSRKDGHPFLTKATLILKGGKLLHSNEATVSPQYDWQLAMMYKDFRSFMHEKADRNEVFYNHLEYCKAMVVKKTWEG